MAELKIMAEIYLCYLDEMKRSNDTYDIFPDNKIFHIKALGDALINYTGMKAGINFRYGLSNYTIETCLICNRDFTDLDVCRTPSCEHLFHSVCICNLEDKNTKELKCPICNAIIPSLI